MHLVSRISLLGLAALLAATSPSLHALNFTWNNVSGGDWNDINNWTPATTPGFPGSGDIGIFNTAVSGNITNAAPASTKYIEFSGSISSINIGSTSGPSFTMGIAGNTTVKNSITGTNKVFAINAPLILTPGSATTSGTYKFDNQSTTAGTSNTLVANGSIASGTTSSTMNLVLTGANGGNNTLSGVISDGGAAGGLSVQKTSTGRWVLSNNANSFTGGVSVDQGTLVVTSIGNTGANSALGTNGTVKLGSAGAVTLIYNGTGETSNKVLDLAGAANVTLYSSGTGSLTLNGALSVSGTGAKTLLLRGDGTGASLSNTFGGAINDGASAIISIDKRDSNTWVFTGANGYTGTTSVTSGTLKVGAGGTTGTLGTGAVSITNAAAVLAFDRSDTITVSNAISGAGVLKQIGSGTLNLTGTNTYTGATTVSAGTLLNNGFLTASAVTVDAGTLGGSGTFGALVTINAGGTLAPGNSPGVAIFNAGLTLGGTTLLEIAGTNRGVTYDALNVASTLSLGGDLHIEVTTSLTGGEAFNLYNAIDGTSAASTTGTFSSISLSGLYAGTLTNDSGVWTALGINGVNFTFDQATGVLTSAAAPIPEPATYAALLAGLTAVGAYLRRRRRP